MSLKGRRQDSHYVTVVGGGSFGTVLANIIASNGHSVYLWLRQESVAQEIRDTGYNSRYLPNLKLDENLNYTADMEEALDKAEIILIAVPSRFFNLVFQKMKPYVKPNHFLVSTAKGFAPDEFLLMSELLERELEVEKNTLDAKSRIGVLSGPNIARELAQKHISGSVIASHNPRLCRLVRDALNNKYLHVFENKDVYGVELAGALKNIYAIAAGISDALGFGGNTKSLLITRAIAEMARFAVRLQANHLTFLGLAGMGDLIVTCNSPVSRNYRLGYALGQGKSTQEAEEQSQGVVEGIHACRSAYKKSKEIGVKMPILEGVYNVVILGKRVKHMLWKAMRNTPREDVEYLMRN